MILRLLFPPPRVSAGRFSKPGLSKGDARPPGTTAHRPGPAARSFCGTIAINLQAGNSQQGARVCRQLDGALLLGGSVLSARSGPRQLHAGEDLTYKSNLLLLLSAFLYLLTPPPVFQVILAQMEVYEKSLKRAQRGLLRKAEWGEAIVPQPEVPQTY